MEKDYIMENLIFLNEKVTLTSSYSFLFINCQRSAAERKSYSKSKGSEVSGFHLLAAVLGAAPSSSKSRLGESVCRVGGRRRLLRYIKY